MKYEILFSYITFFEEAEGIAAWESAKKRSDGVIEMGYPVYDKTFSGFIDDIYQTDLLHSDYLDILHKNGFDSTNLAAAIPTASLETLRAILTYFVRQERFSDGTWAAAIKEKLFLKILYRLKELVDS